MVVGRIESGASSETIGGLPDPFVTDIAKIDPCCGQFEIEGNERPGLLAHLATCFYSYLRSHRERSKSFDA
jgi:hypothetical protein